MSAGQSVWIPASELVTDTALAKWAQERQSGDLHRVDFQVPSGFEGYCRIFHRVQSSGEGMPWSHFAERAGVAMRADIHWTEIERKLGNQIGIGPETGSMDDASFQSFLQVIRDRHESDIELIAGFWNGIYKFGILGSETVELGLRDQVLFKSGLDALIDAARTGVADFPGLLWPSDRMWYMSTEIDYNSTLLGGPLDLIETVLSADSLEALPAWPDLDLTY